MMTYVRKNVYELGGDWADPILWYARAVGMMQKQPIATRSSWRFFAAMHGIDTGLWKNFGYLKPGEAMPNSSDQSAFWNQCQHGSWYFLPWHRGYLLAWEATVRAAVVKLGGPADWAVPYWDYFQPSQNKLPPAFGSKTMPDGSVNPLFVPQRWGPNNNGNVYVNMSQVNLDAMQDTDFTGTGGGGSTGFGGVDTGFSHSGSVHGGIETQPHDWVHGLVGGAQPSNSNIPGLMSDPDTAGLDPIFWLHHANIDRLWEVWLHNPPVHVNPTDTHWINGPAAVGQRKFVMPMPDASTWVYTPGEMADLGALNYTYSDMSPDPSLTLSADRLQRLNPNLSAFAVPKMVTAMKFAKNVELVGANAGSLPLVGGEAHTSVRLSPVVRAKVAESLRFATAAVAGEPAATAAVPDRVFLNLENVRGVADATSFRVYINLPGGANPMDHPENLAGAVSLFGVRKASQSDGEHGGQGLTFVLEVTKVIDALHLAGTLDTDTLDVQIVPTRPVPEEAKVTIGRISLFRQGQ
jgi:tyrosinase